MNERATVEYRCSIGGKLIRVKRHLNQLCPFMGSHEHELEAPTETMRIVEDDPAEALNVAMGAGEVVLDKLDGDPEEPQVAM